MLLLVLQIYSNWLSSLISAGHAHGAQNDGRGDGCGLVPQSGPYARGGRDGGVGPCGEELRGELLAPGFAGGEIHQRGAGV